MLDSAQVALVRENPGLYRNRIDAAREWVEHNFNSDAALTRDWVERLDRAGSSFGDVAVPDISASLSAILALGRHAPGEQEP